MSYLVLARKWRPQGFDELIGQEAVVKTLKNAIKSGKVVHAYLFSGPRGVGKTSAARILSKALNCAKGPAPDPCEECANCKAIASGYSVDVFEIDGASNNSVEDVRGLREAVKYAPSSGRYKIYIIDEVHMLSESAFNALLKTLEEPPSHVIFVFATTAPKKLPATILSRCQHHAFRRIPKGRIKEQLLKISETENINIKDTAVEMIARAADGSMRDALTMLDQASSFSDEIGENELQALLGLPRTDIILKFSEAILEGNISRNLTIIKELTDSGYDLRPIVRELVEHFRNLAIVKISQNPEALLEFTESEIKSLRQQASNVSMEELTLLMSQLMRLEAELRGAANPRYVLELGLLRTSFVKGMTSIGDLLKKLDGETFESATKQKLLEQDFRSQSKLPATDNETVNIEGTLSVQDKTLISKKDAKDDEKNPPLPPFDKGGMGGFLGEVSNNSEQELWQKVIEKIRSEHSYLECKLEKAKIIGLTKTDLTIGFNGGMSVFVDSVKENTGVVEDAIKDITGQRLKLKIVSLPGLNGGKGINEVKEHILSDPTVKNILELFNGKLLQIKPLDGSEQ